MSAAITGGQALSALAGFAFLLWLLSKPYYAWRHLCFTRVCLSCENPEMTTLIPHGPYCNRCGSQRYRWKRERTMVEALIVAGAILVAALNERCGTEVRDRR